MSLFPQIVGMRSRHCPKESTRVSQLLIIASKASKDFKVTGVELWSLHFLKHGWNWSKSV